MIASGGTSSGFSIACMSARAGYAAALTATIAGFSLTMLGTDFCSAAIDVGPEMQPAELWALAEQRFNTAIDVATRINQQTLLNAARLGRARVRLYMGKRTEAAADARLVPAGFVWNATASTVIR